MSIKAYSKISILEARAPVDGGIFYFGFSYLIQFIKVLILVGIWKSVYAYSGNYPSIEASQIILYTVLAGAFFQQFDVETTASATFWEGTVSNRYLKPLNIQGQFISETIGRWIPGIFYFTIPLLLCSYFFGLEFKPLLSENTLFGFISMILGICVGFALDFIFVGIMVFAGNMHYMAQQIKRAVVVILSGAVVPLYIMPEKLHRVLELLPFASMTSAPLLIYTGKEEPIRLIVLQLFWSVILWTISILIWRKIKERLVIYGG